MIWMLACLLVSHWCTDWRGVDLRDHDAHLNFLNHLNCQEPDVFQLLLRMLSWEPAGRPTFAEAVHHECFNAVKGKADREAEIELEFQNVMDQIDSDEEN